MRRFNRLLAALFICVSIALVDSYFSAEAALIVSVAGVPKITKSSNNEVRTCKTGMEVNPGDVISTLLDERVDIALDDKADRILRIDENSYVRINTQDFINLSRGTIYAKIKSMPKDSKFEVRTPVAICGARGTGWKVETNDEKSSFSAFENSIYVKGIDQAGNIMPDELIVKDGWKTDVAKFEKPEKLRELSKAEMKEWGDWVKGLASPSSKVNDIERVDRIVNKIEKIESAKESVKEVRDETNRLERDDRSESRSETGTELQTSPGAG